MFDNHGHSDEDVEDSIQVTSNRTDSLPKSKRSDSWNIFGLKVNEEQQAEIEQENTSVLDGANIVAYSTSLFQRIRLLDGIDYKSISGSLNPAKNRDQIFSSGEASGASGSFFFFSHDKRFIVKTMTKDELELIQKVLPTIYKHFKKYPNSLLARIYGVYEVRMKNYEPVMLLLMGNTLRFRRKEDIYKIYDLKGS